MDNLRKQADMTQRICSIPDCEKPYAAKGYCKNHYYTQRIKRCTLEGCNRAYAAKGLCKVHWKERTGPKRYCAECGAQFAAQDKRKFCSTDCRNLAMQSPMRRAVNAGDPVAIIAAALSQSVVTEAGCWEWQYAKSPRGYPMIGHGGSGGFVHRHVAMAACGRVIPKSEPVHHKCANPSCVNPDHLQPVTTRENIAEMFERNHYLKRIAELESALSLASPGHPLLPT